MEVIGRALALTLSKIQRNQFRAQESHDMIYFFFLNHSAFLVENRLYMGKS